MYPRTKEEIKIRAYVEFLKSVRNDVETFQEFDAIVRESINAKGVGMLEDEFNRSLTVYGGLLK